MIKKMRVRRRVIDTRATCNPYVYKKYMDMETAYWTRGEEDEKALYELMMEQDLAWTIKC